MVFSELVSFRTQAAVHLCSLPQAWGYYRGQDIFSSYLLSIPYIKVPVSDIYRKWPLQFTWKRPNKERKMVWIWKQTNLFQSGRRISSNLIPIYYPGNWHWVSPGPWPSAVLWKQSRASNPVTCVQRGVLAIFQAYAAEPNIHKQPVILTQGSILHKGEYRYQDTLAGFKEDKTHLANINVCCNTRS